MYQAVMRNFKLLPVWKHEHTECFLQLKQKLLSEPALQAPWYEEVYNHSFIVTTDGSKDTFVGVLLRTVLPGRKVAVHRHPIAFVSKHTLPAEE
jgi:hypothetical protein